MANYTIREVCDNEWFKAAALVATAVPNALISKLGNRFGATFYSEIVEQSCACGYVARDASDNVVGVIIGTTDNTKVRSIAFKGNILKLAIAANFRLIGPSVINWVIKGIVERVKGRTGCQMNGPRAELIAIVVCPEAKGTGLAGELIEKLEKFMVSKGLRSPYTIFTEKANKRANKFYEKIGATFVGTSFYHGREINQWHKEIVLAKRDE